MITVFGSIGMDLLFSLPHLPAVGGTVLTPDYATAMGGKGANQAVAAARDGGRVHFVGSAGTEGFGTEARSLLQAKGIDLVGFATVDAATCVASIWFDTQGRNQIVVASGANLLTRADALRAEILASGDWLVLQMEIPNGEVSKAVAIAKACNARIILNLAPALPVEEAALRQVDVLVLNEHEASQLCTHIGLASGLPAKLAGPISTLLGTTVIVTLGPAGAVAAKGDQIWQVPTVPVKAVDTTGAGDCFVGVLAAALDRGLEMQPAMRRACVAARVRWSVPHRASRPEWQSMWCWINLDGKAENPDRLRSRPRRCRRAAVRGAASRFLSVSRPCTATTASRTHAQCAGRARTGWHRGAAGTRLRRTASYAERWHS